MVLIDNLFNFLRYPKSAVKRNALLAEHFLASFICQNTFSLVWGY